MYNFVFKDWIASTQDATQTDTPQTLTAEAKINDEISSRGCITAQRLKQ